MKPLFKKGDIVYFTEEFRSHYSSGYYYHKPNQPYIVVSFTGFSNSIQNLEDVDSGAHFVLAEMRNYLISESEWKILNRQKKLNHLLNSNMLSLECCLETGKPHNTPFEWFRKLRIKRNS